MSELTQTLVKEILHYDEHTGVFIWRNPTSRRTKPGTVAGSIHWEGYARIMILGKEYLQHRLAWLYYYGHWPKYEIDHVNGIRNDNRICNLRDIPRQLNQQNRQRANRTNTSTGILGVTYRKREKSYEAKISIDGVNKTLGRFKTLGEAQQAYLQAKKDHHPGFIL